MHKFLVVVDMQNDFITGSLGSKQAEAIVPEVCKLIQSMDHKDTSVLATLDTHDENYLSSLEGRMLPVEHCICHTDGWNMCWDVHELLTCMAHADVRYERKCTFGSVTLAMRLRYEVENGDEIHICGLCTDICVVANALLLRAFLPNTRIVLHAKACAGTSTEAHNAAIAVMKSNQIEVED